MADDNKIKDRLPHSEEAEKAVIGCLLQDNNTIEEVFANINADMFYDDRLRAIFIGIGELRKEGSDVDRITAKDKSKPILYRNMKEKTQGVREKAKQIEGYDETSLSDEFFVDILSGAAYDTNVMSYCDIIRDKYVRRRSMSIAADILANCQSGEKTAEEICNVAQDEYYKLGTSNATNQYKKASDFVGQIFDEIVAAKNSKNGITGIATGYRNLDNETAGLQNSDMIVLAGRPGMGKTAFALNLAYNISAIQDKSVLFFSLEMGGSQLVKRLISAQSGVSGQSIRSGRVSDDDMARMVDSAIKLDDMKFYINEDTLLTIADFTNKCRKLKNSKEGLDIVFIDYLQLMKAGDNYKNASKRGFDNRQVEVAEISRNVKALAKELNIPIIALSQLSRDAESSTPKLSDLRESGAIEQDADIVLFIHREKDKEGVESDNTDLIIAKHRNGSTGKISFRFDKETTRFLEINDRTPIPSDARK